MVTHQQEVSKEVYLKEVSREFQGSFKHVLRKFQGCLRIVSSMFQENFEKKKFQGFFKNISMDFCFAILLLHGTQQATQAEGGLVFYLCPYLFLLSV